MVREVFSVFQKGVEVPTCCERGILSLLVIFTVKKMCDVNFTVNLRDVNLTSRKFYGTVFLENKRN